jgi:protein-tyrosine phosphatase
MNRSGLVAGLLLRGFGVDHEQAVRLIRAARPGALSNETFVRLLAEV